MDAIKKKMQAMKLEKDNALDRAVFNEQQAKDANLRAEKAEEEARSLQKKIQTIENDLDQTQEQLMQANAKFEEKEKAFEMYRIVSGLMRHYKQLRNKSNNTIRNIKKEFFEKFSREMERDIYGGQKAFEDDKINEKRH